jgi:hypothetical protein
MHACGVVVVCEAQELNQGNMVACFKVGVARLATAWRVCSVCCSCIMS